MENQPVISLKNRPYHRDCVLWNEDGQLAICLDSNVHIITPILVDLSSKEEGYKHVGFSLPDFSQQEEKGTAVVNTDELQTSYYNDEGFRCVSWSQTGVSNSQSCLLAVVTTKHRVLLYNCSTRDPLNSDWQLYVNMTDDIKANAITHEYPTKINPHHTLCASWSKKIISDPLATQPSLLALANKAGDTCIWIVDDKGTKYLATVSPHTSFVNLVEWTNWKKSEDGNTHTAYFASTSTNGTVALSSITVKTKVGSSTTSIQDVQVKTLHTWFTDKPSTPTLLKIHDDFEDGSPFVRIAVSKGITVWFISVSVADDAMDIDREWKPYDLQNSALGLSAGSWINDFNFRCYTMEGEGLQFYFSATEEVSLLEEAHGTLNSKLIQKYRQQWFDEQEKADDDDVLGALDALPYLWGAGDSLDHIFTSVYFSLRPTLDLHYRPDSSEEANLTFILQKPRGLDSRSLIDKIETYVTNPDFLFIKPVRGLLRETLAYLVEDDNFTPLENWFAKLMECMNSDPVFDNSNLTKSIYCEPSTIASRIITNAQLEMKSYKMIVYEDALDKIFKKGRDNTLERFFICLFDYVLQLPDEKFTQFNVQDKMVLLLLADTALSKNSENTNEHTLQVYVKLQDKFSDLSLYEEIAYLSKPDGLFNTKAREKCPVCDEMVQSIDGGTLAQCQAGHFWELCSITRRVLFSPNTRKCSCCGAKSLQPSGDGSLADIILSHCIRCIYCGAGLLSS